MKMFVQFKGYFSVNVISQRRYYNIGRSIKECLFLKGTNYWNNIRCLTNIIPNIEVSNEYKPKNVYLPFEQMLEKRRLQAKRSILVQVHSEQSCAQLYEYCSSCFGTVNSIMHYSLQSNMHFAIVEFSEESAALNVVQKSSHTDSPQIIPVRSHFLWFKANDQGKRKKGTSKEVDMPFTKFGSIAPPKYDELISWLIASNDISEQMQLLYKAIHLDDLGTRMRFISAVQIENTLSGMFPFVRALPYGSSVNTFGNLGCDLDVVISMDFQQHGAIPDNRLIFQTKTSLVNNRTQQQRYIESIGDLIDRYLPGCCGVKKILMARVPIIKFKQEYTGIECDVSLMNVTGVYMSELLYIYGSMDERVRPLVYTVRYWAKVMNLTNTTPGRWITNFSLTLLVLFYLQSINMIPTLDKLIKLSKTEDRRFAEDVNCTFLRDISSLLNGPVSNTMTIAELLKGFFDFYALFDFDSNAISLRSGKPIPKQEYSALYIVNPLESHLNVSKNVSPEELGRLRIEMCNAARYLDLELRNNEHNEDWGLITLFQSSHYSSKAKEVIYSAIQRKQQVVDSNNRLITITDLFAEESDGLTNDDITTKQPSYQNGPPIKKSTRRKR